MRGRNIEMFAMTENVLLLDSLVEFRDAPA